ncbi:MAG TPA: hypothetical protein PJ994_13735, partial [Tepidiformaceae bacterium]|nr:hypothetical protein [Tepidiformaceae bacterium]
MRRFAALRAASTEQYLIGALGQQQWEAVRSDRELRLPMYMNVAFAPGVAPDRTSPVTNQVSFECGSRRRSVIYESPGGRPVDATFLLVRRGYSASLRGVPSVRTGEGAFAPVWKVSGRLDRVEIDGQPLPDLETTVIRGASGIPILELEQRARSPLDFYHETPEVGDGGSQLIAVFTNEAVWQCPVVFHGYFTTQSPIGPGDYVCARGSPFSMFQGAGGLVSARVLVSSDEDCLILPWWASAAERRLWLNLQWSTHSLRTRHSSSFLVYSSVLILATLLLLCL